MSKLFKDDLKKIDEEFKLINKLNDDNPEELIKHIFEIKKIIMYYRHYYPKTLLYKLIDEMIKLKSFNKGSAKTGRLLLNEKHKEYHDKLKRMSEDYKKETYGEDNGYN